MSFYQKLKDFLVWVFRGNAETREARKIKKAQEKEIKKLERDAYYEARKSEAQNLAKAKAETETKNKIKALEKSKSSGTGFSKVFSTLTDLGDNFNKNTRGGKAYKPVSIFSEPKKQKPFDIDKIL